MLLKIQASKTVKIFSLLYIAISRSFKIVVDEGCWKFWRIKRWVKILRPHIHMTQKITCSCMCIYSKMYKLVSVKLENNLLRILTELSISLELGVWGVREEISCLLGMMSYMSYLHYTPTAPWEHGGVEIGEELSCLRGQCVTDLGSSIT